MRDNSIVMLLLSKTAKKKQDLTFSPFSRPYSPCGEAALWYILAENIVQLCYIEKVCFRRPVAKPAVAVQNIMEFTSRRNIQNLDREVVV